MKHIILFLLLGGLNYGVYSQNNVGQTISTAWGNYLTTGMPAFGNTLIQIRVNGQNSTWSGNFTVNGENSYTLDNTWNNVKLLSYSGYNAGTDDVQVLIMSNSTTNSFGGANVVIKLGSPANGSATITVVATGANAAYLSLSHNASSSPFNYTMATSAGTYNIWTVNNNVGIGTTSPYQKLGIAGGLRIDNNGAFNSEVNSSTSNTKEWLSFGPDGSGEGIGANRVGDKPNLCGLTFYTNYQSQLYLTNAGNMGIGTSDTKGYKLAVNGSAIFTKAVVKNYGNWPDYVFDPTYKLPSLDSVSTFIKENKHLPEMPSAAMIEEEGQDVGNIQKVLLKKVEELTLYVIELKNEIDQLKKNK